jgi:hypothetical protein
LRHSHAESGKEQVATNGSGFKSTESHSFNR